MKPAAVVFDLYGTLLDYSALAERYAGVVPSPQTFVAAWRSKQLAYALAATLMDRYVDFDVLTARSYAYVAAVHGVPAGDEACEEAVKAWQRLPAFSDVDETLQALRTERVPTAVLSNGKPESIALALANAQLAGRFGQVLSVDSVRRFKPHPDVYTLATSAFACEAERIVFVSSNGWDATGAAEFGFRVAWCNRGGLPAETYGATPAVTIESLAELTQILE